MKSESEILVHGSTVTVTKSLMSDPQKDANIVAVSFPKSVSLSKMNPSFKTTHMKPHKDEHKSTPFTKTASTQDIPLYPHSSYHNIRDEDHITTQPLVDREAAFETHQQKYSGLPFLVRLPGSDNMTVLDDGILPTSKDKHNSSVSNVNDDPNNVTKATSRSKKSTPNSQTRIKSTPDNRGSESSHSALSRTSSKKSGAFQISDGNNAANEEGYPLIQGGGSPSCHDPLLMATTVGVSETKGEITTVPDERNSSFTPVNDTTCFKTIMGDLQDLEKFVPMTHVLPETDDIRSDIHLNGIANGDINSMKNVDGNMRTDDGKVNGYSLYNDDKDDGSGSCGWGKFRFEFCQKFRSVKWYLVVLTLCGACQGMAVNGFVNTVISTIERRFEISSTESGLIASCYDIMFVILVIPISYFGGQGHKPRYLGAGIFVMGVGSFVFALPHFLTENYHVEDANEAVCKLPSNSTAICNADSSTSLSNYKYLFYLGQLLHGAGATPLYTLGITYMDENVPQRSSSFYNGIFYTGSIIGPAIGYMVGAKFLDFYTDVFVDPKSLGLDPNNPKWVGAWWIGFLISGFIGVLLSLPLLAFPASLPGSGKFALERGKETQASKEIDQTGQHRGLKDIILSLKYLLTNIPFMFINIAAAADGVLIAGFSTFMPKFIEYEFGLSAGTAALYVGLAVVPAGGGATFGGGFIVKYFNLKMRGILRLCTVMSFILCFLAVALLMECDTTPFAGVTLSYGQTDVGAASFLGKNLENSCNQNCSCSEEDFFPVCGRDNVLYFSPCYAGCTDVFSQGDAKRYANCSCINYNLTTADLASGSTYMAEFGKCEFKCKWLTVFLLCFGAMIIFVFITSMPSLTATLRCVPDHQRSFALGIQWIVARCFGSIPGPLLFGKMFDFACLLWQKRCNGDGSCFFYDTHNLSIYLFAVALAFAIAAAVAFLLALCFYKVKEEEDEIILQVDRSTPQSPHIPAAHNNIHFSNHAEKLNTRTDVEHNNTDYGTSL